MLTPNLYYQHFDGKNEVINLTGKLRIIDQWEPNLSITFILCNLSVFSEIGQASEKMKK